MTNNLKTSCIDVSTKELSFEYEDNGLLIVDKMYNDPHYLSACIVVICNEYFILPHKIGIETGKDAAKSLRKISSKHYVDPEWECSDCEYLIHNCIPRNGVNIKLGRAITQTELMELIQEYKLSRKDISDEFENTIGLVFGEKYAKTYTAVQIRVCGFVALPLATYLKEKGIEAMNVAFGRINIRVK